MKVDEETRDALRVVRNLAATAGLDMDAPEWKCIRIVTEKFDLATDGAVSHPVERFRAQPTEEEE